MERRNFINMSQYTYYFVFSEYADHEVSTCTIWFDYAASPSSEQAADVPAASNGV
jgi:hypothetical protein